MKSCDVNSKVKIYGMPNYGAHITCEYTESQEAPKHILVECRNLFHEEKKE
jgi:hypothetical protein